MVNSPAPIRSPPTCAMGNSTLAASRMKRTTTHVPSCGRALAGKSSHQPTPAIETVAARTATTRAIPHPTLTTAWATASSPDQMITALTAAMPVNQAIKPACATISGPIPHACLESTAGWRVVPTNRSMDEPARLVARSGPRQPPCPSEDPLPGRFHVERAGLPQIPWSGPPQRTVPIPSRGIFSRPTAPARTRTSLAQEGLSAVLQSLDQAVSTARGYDRRKLVAPRRQITDGPVEIDVDHPPAADQIVYVHGPPPGLEQLGLNDFAATS